MILSFLSHFAIIKTLKKIRKKIRKMNKKHQKTLRLLPARQISRLH